MNTNMLLAALLIFIPLSILSQPVWELQKQENGINVYTCKLHQSGFKSVKVECTLQGTTEKLTAILKNVNSDKHWVYNTKRTYLVKTVSNNEFIYYAETSLPWPLRNRDEVINMFFTTDSAGKKLIVKATGLPDGVAVQDGIVRVPYFNGLWEVTTVDSNHIRIAYQLSVDPGGSVPAWAYNMFVSKGPYKTFINLAALLQQ